MKKATDIIKDLSNCIEDKGNDRVYVQIGNKIVDIESIMTIGRRTSKHYIVISIKEGIQQT